MKQGLRQHASFFTIVLFHSLVSTPNCEFIGRAFLSFFSFIYDLSLLWNLVFMLVLWKPILFQFLGVSSRRLWCSGNLGLNVSQISFQFLLLNDISFNDFYSLKLDMKRRMNPSTSRLWSRFPLRTDGLQTTWLCWLEKEKASVLPAAFNIGNALISFFYWMSDSPSFSTLSREGR